MNEQEHLRSRVHGDESVTAAIWNPDLHPRGKDGQFIEKFGIIKLFDYTDKKGKRRSEGRGTVLDIRPNTSTPGNPDIIVELDDGSRLSVKPNQVSSATDAKARLDVSDEVTPESILAENRVPTAQEIKLLDLANRPGQSGDRDPKRDYTPAEVELRNRYRKAHENDYENLTWEDDPLGGQNLDDAIKMPVFHRQEQYEAARRRKAAQKPGARLKRVGQALNPYRRIYGAPEDWWRAVERGDAPMPGARRGSIEPVDHAKVDLYLEWEQALNQPEVDAALVASLESKARDMELDLWQINNLMLNSMTAAINIQWNPDLHPRGRDGKFIESFGLVRLFDFTDRKGNRWPESSGKVTDITPDPDNPGNPDIEVELPEGGHVTVKPNQVASAPDIKARLGDRELGEARSETEFNYIGAPDFEPEAETVEEQLEEDIAFADTIYNTSRDVGMLNVGDEIILPGDMPGTIVEFEFPGDRPDSVKVHTDGGTYHGKTTDILPNYRPGEEVNPIGEPVMEKPGELGSKSNPIKTADPLEAVEALRDGKFVELESVDQVSTLLTELADIAAEAKAAGEEAPNYDLCLVSVPGTNLFCAESKGIPRIEMPQLSGFPVPGSKADSLPRTEEGGVDIGPAFMDHLRSKGVGVKEERRLASHLKASQSELIGSKIAGMMRAMDSGNDFAIRNIRENPIFVTSDGYVIDGHHRWASVVGWDALEGGIEDYDMPVRTIDMDIMEVLSEANKFANDFGIPQVSSFDIGPEIKKPETEGEAFRRRNVESELARAAEMRRRE